MQYNIILNWQDINIIAKMLQEWPYRIVKPVIDSIASQIDIQNQKETEETEEKDLTTKKE